MSREEHKNAIEVSVIFHEGQRMFAVPKQSAQQQEPMDEIRCPECGYLTKHTEHIGCLRNQLNAINAFEQRNFAIVNMDTSPQPAQPLPFGVGGGLVAIKTLLSRDPCGHANTAIQMIDAILAEQPAQRKPLPYNKEDMKDLDVNQRLAFKLGWKSAEDAHGIKENT